MQKNDFYRIAFFVLLGAIVTGGVVHFFMGNRDFFVNKRPKAGELKNPGIEGDIKEENVGKEFYDFSSSSEKDKQDKQDKQDKNGESDDSKKSSVLRYVSEDYYFSLSLPLSWRGYQIEREKTFDNSLETLSFGFSEQGSLKPLFSIHIFTPDQWKQVTNEGADDYMMGRKLEASEDYVFMWEQGIDASSAETSKYYRDIEKIKGSFKTDLSSLDQVMEWRKHVSHIGVTLKYPNDGTYSVKTPDSDTLVISQGKHPGSKFSVKEYDYKCNSEDILIPKRDSHEEKDFNGETYDSFFRIGMGDPYGYYIEKEGKCYVFESLWGPENETFEAIMETVTFD
jgi:hypothetical protein